MKIGIAGTGRIGARHAAALAAHPDVEALIVQDDDVARAQEVAASLGVTAAGSLEELFDAGIDGFAIATATPAHAPLIEFAVARGVTTFCEKPIAMTTARTREVVARVAESGVEVQIGFQRRFDAGYRSARESVRSGELGELRRIHTVSADPAPPHASYIPESGGIYRDLAIHDLDIVRWVSGREVSEVYATGANRGEAFFADAGDVDESVALLTLDDHTLVTMQGSRYNGAGYDIRMEVAGTLATRVVGLSERTPFRSAEPGVTFPDGEPWQLFWDRFEPSYTGQLHAFIELVAGRTTTPCSVEDALQSLYVAEALDLSRAEHRPVTIAEVQAR